MRISALMVVIAMAANGCAKHGWQADPVLVQRLSAERPGVNYVESDVRKFVLPDPLRMADGTKVKSVEQWDARRAELLELFTTRMFGRSPGKPQELRFETIEENANALGGRATMRRVAIHSTQDGRHHSFEVDLFIPNGVSGPVPALLLIDNRGGATTAPVRGGPSDFWPVEQ